MSDRKEPLTHVNVRLPEYVLKYFKAYPNYTKAIRQVLEQHVREANAPEPPNNC